MIGDSRWSWRRTNQTPSPMPATIERIGNGAKPPCAISFSPKTTARMATSDIATLPRSIGRAFGSRYSGRVRGPRMSSSPMTGTPMRNTEPHQKNSRSTPPRTGPMAPPAE